MTPQNEPRHDPLPHADLVRKRQRSRAAVLAVLLGIFVVLVFAISIAKIQAGMGQHDAGRIVQGNQH